MIATTRAAAAQSSEAVRRAGR